MRAGRKIFLIVPKCLTRLPAHGTPGAMELDATLNERITGRI
jgi:hypothetical protein